jgi:hypothetical protein
MAARSDTRSRFIAQLLSPLPEGVEPAETKEFSRQIRSDRKEIWQRAMMHVYATNELRSYYATRASIARQENRSDADEWTSWTLADIEHWSKVDQQMQLPAPTKGALDWKKKTRKYRGGDPSWEIAIARDEARFSAQPAVMS